MRRIAQRSTGAFHLHASGRACSTAAIKAVDRVASSRPSPRTSLSQQGVLDPAEPGSPHSDEQLTQPSSSRQSLPQTGQLLQAHAFPPWPPQDTSRSQKEASVSSQQVGGFDSAVSAWPDSPPEDPPDVRDEAANSRAVGGAQGGPTPTAASACTSVDPCTDDVWDKVGKLLAGRKRVTAKADVVQPVRSLRRAQQDDTAGCTSGRGTGQSDLLPPAGRNSDRSTVKADDAPLVRSRRAQQDGAVGAASDSGTLVADVSPVRSKRAQQDDISRSRGAIASKQSLSEAHLTSAKSAHAVSSVRQRADGAYKILRPPTKARTAGDAASTSGSNATTAAALAAAAAIAAAAAAEQAAAAEAAIAAAAAKLTLLPPPRSLLDAGSPAAQVTHAPMRAIALPIASPDDSEVGDLLDPALPADARALLLSRRRTRRSVSVTPDAADRRNALALVTSRAFYAQRRDEMRFRYALRLLDIKLGRKRRTARQLMTQFVVEGERKGYEQHVRRMLQRDTRRARRSKAAMKPLDELTEEARAEQLQKLDAVAAAMDEQLGVQLPAKAFLGRRADVLSALTPVDVATRCQAWVTTCGAHHTAMFLSKEPALLVRDPLDLLTTLEVFHSTMGLTTDASVAFMLRNTHLVGVDPARPLEVVEQLKQLLQLSDPVARKITLKNTQLLTKGKGLLTQHVQSLRVLLPLTRDRLAVLVERRPALLTRSIASVARTLLDLATALHMDVFDVAGMVAGQPGMLGVAPAKLVQRWWRLQMYSRLHLPWGDQIHQMNPAALARCLVATDSHIDYLQQVLEQGLQGEVWAANLKRLLTMSQGQFDRAAAAALVRAQEVKRSVGGGRSFRIVRG